MISRAMSAVPRAAAGLVRRRLLSTAAPVGMSVMATPLRAVLRRAAIGRHSVMWRCPVAAAASPPAASDAPLPAALLTGASKAPQYADNVSVSERCFANIARVNAAEQHDSLKRFLRLAIESGGCQGFTYKFTFDDELDATEDVVFTQSPVPSGASSSSTVSQGPSPPFVVVDETTLTKLRGAVIDYHTELKGSAFVVVGNELVDHSCACAMSFALKGSK